MTRSVLKKKLSRKERLGADDSPSIFEPDHMCDHLCITDGVSRRSAGALSSVRGVFYKYTYTQSRCIGTDWISFIAIFEQMVGFESRELRSRAHASVLPTLSFENLLIIDFSLYINSIHFPYIWFY